LNKAKITTKQEYEKNKLPEMDICYCRELHFTHRRRVLVVHFPHNDLLHSR